MEKTKGKSEVKSGVREMKWNNKQIKNKGKNQHTSTPDSHNHNHNHNQITTTVTGEMPL